MTTDRDREAFDAWARDLGMSTGTDDQGRYANPTLNHGLAAYRRGRSDEAHAREAGAQEPVAVVGRGVTHFVADEPPPGTKLYTHPAPAQVPVPVLEKLPGLADHEFLLLASYCGPDADGCSEQKPCPECLAMCNVFGDDGKYLRQLGTIAPAQEPVAVPAGWKLVPVEPTREMQIAGRDAILSEDPHIDLSSDDAREAYRAMLAAAPVSPPADHSEDTLDMVKAPPAESGEVERLREALETIKAASVDGWFAKIAEEAIATQPPAHRRVQDAAPAHPELDAEAPPSALDQPRAWWAETGTAGAGEGCNKPFWLRHEAVAYVRQHGGYVAPLFRRYEAPQPGGAVKVKARPFDLATMLKHAWIAGKTGTAWEDYDPTELVVYQRLAETLGIPLPTPAGEGQ